MSNIDESKRVRPGEELPEAQLHIYLLQYLEGYQKIEGIRQFPGGYSNLTYLIQTNIGEFVLRRPPFGAQIKSAHDMSREFRVLNLLQPVYPRVPKPILLCESDAVLGAPFYLMEKVNGIILRNQIPESLSLSPDVMRAISCTAIDNLVDLHAIDTIATGLDQLGKPQGYVERQVEGWIQRYFKAETDTLETMNQLADWMRTHYPKEQAPTLLHNDYKYDNLVLNPDNLGEIIAVLDWEMCTVGDPLMDLGVMLGYWIEADEVSPLLHGISNLTWLPGNLTRLELAERYAARSGRNLDDILFYYVFGLFKIGVIVQQIYYRYKQGFTNDPRFASLIEVVRLFGVKGSNALNRDSLAR